MKCFGLLSSGIVTHANFFRIITQGSAQRRIFADGAARGWDVFRVYFIVKLLKNHSAVENLKILKLKVLKFLLSATLPIHFEDGACPYSPQQSHPC